MEIDASLLTANAQWFSGLLAFCVLLAVLWAAPWRALLAVSARQHLFFLVVLSLLIIWVASFHPVSGISLHLLGMTAATLLLGTALAALAGLLALLGLVLLHEGTLAAVPLAWLLGVVVPALTTGALVRLLDRLGVRNLFAFLLGIGFAGAMVTVLAVAAAGLLTLALAGRPELVAAALDHVAMLPLLLFPEGFINGAAISTLTVYFPHLVRCFDEERFLGGPGA